MGLRFKNQKLSDCFFVTTSFRDHIPWGNIADVYKNLVQAFEFQLLETRSKLIAYVFMPSHWHAIMIINGKLLSEFMRDFKKYTSQKTLCDLCGTNLIWQQRYDRQAIMSQKILIVKMKYIHFNPVKAGLVTNPEDWKWSSAGNYLNDRKGPLEVYKEWYY